MWKCYVVAEEEEEEDDEEEEEDVEGGVGWSVHFEQVVFWLYIAVINFPPMKKPNYRRHASQKQRWLMILHSL